MGPNNGKEGELNNPYDIADPDYLGADPPKVGKKPGINKNPVSKLWAIFKPKTPK